MTIAPRRPLLMKIFAVLCLLLATVPSIAQSTPAATSAGRSIRPNARVFIEPMDGFETYLTAAILKKKVPLIVTDDKAKSDYVITGTSHVDKAGWAKTIFISGAP